MLFSNLDYIASNEMMISDWWTGKKVISRHLSGGTEENLRQTSVCIVGLRAEI
jgi:hypothetical protein